MTLNLRYTESDYIAAQTIWLKQHPFTLIRGFWYPIAVLVVVAIAVANHPEHWQNALVAVLIAIGLIAFSLLTTWWRLHRQFGKVSWMQGDVLATLDGQGIRLKGEEFEINFDWDAIAGIHETNKILLFAISKNAFFFIPKRDFSDALLDEIRRIIASNARGKAKLAPGFAQA